MINRVIFYKTENILQKKPDKPDLSENKNCQSFCNANDVLNHLHFTGATRFFKKSLVATPDEIESIMTERFKDKSNGILGSLPYSLIKELKEVSKDKATMDKNVKEIYKAFRDAAEIYRMVENQPEEIVKGVLEGCINPVLEKAGIKNNLFEYSFEYFDGTFGMPVCFKLGEEEYVLKVMKDTISQEDLTKYQSGKHIEPTRALFLNHFKVTTAISYIPEKKSEQIKDKNAVHYLKYVKMLWGDTKAGYIVTKHEDRKASRNEPFRFERNENLFLNLKPISELYSGCQSYDLRECNIKNSTIIDPGVVFIREKMDKTQRAEYKKLIQSVFKPSTPDEFLNNIVNHQKDFKNGFWDIEYVSYALSKAFDNCSRKTKKMLSQQAGDELRSCIIKRDIKSKLLYSDHFSYLIENSSDDVKDKACLVVLNLPQNIRFKAFTSFFPTQSEDVKNNLADIVGTFQDKDKLEAIKLLLPDASDEIRESLLHQASSESFDTIENQVMFLFEIKKNSSPEFKKYMKDYIKVAFIGGEGLLIRINNLEQAENYL